MRFLAKVAIFLKVMLPVHPNLCHARLGHFCNFKTIFRLCCVRVQCRLQSPKHCTMKHLKNTKRYSVEFLRTEMVSDPSNCHREYLFDNSYSLFHFEASDVISVLKT